MVNREKFITNYVERIIGYKPNGVANKFGILGHMDEPKVPFYKKVIIYIIVNY
jgi:hypothetical protein